MKEIIRYSEPQPTSSTVPWMRGVINLRGSIVPIIDLRIKFSLSEATYTAHTVVIILNIRERIFGVVVDGVSDVMMLRPEEIKAAPEFGAAFNTEYLMGLGALGSRMLILLDIDRLMSSAEMGLLDAAAA